MKFKTTYILFAVLGVMLILLAWAMISVNAPSDVSNYAVPAAHDPKHPFEVTDVDRVEIKRVRPTEEIFVFVKDSASGKWEIQEPRQLRAGPAVGDLVSEVLSATRDTEAEEPPSAKDAGLDPPAEVVTLKKGNERSVQLNVGKASSESSQAVVYVSTPERPKDVIPVLRSKLSMVLSALNDFRDPYLLASSTSDYKFIKLALNKADKKDEPKGQLILNKRDEGIWEYKDYDGYDGSADMGNVGALPQPDKPPSGVDGLLKVLSDLKVEKPEKDKPSDWVEDGATDLGKYGLDATKSDVLTVYVDRIVAGKGESGPEKTLPATLLVALGKKVDEKTENGKTTGGKYYAAVQDPDHGTTVVKIPAAGIDSVAQEFKDPAALRSRMLAALGNKPPLAVDVVNGSGKLEFRRLTGDQFGGDKGKWRLYRDGKEVPTDSAAVELMVNQLVQPGQVRSFINDAKPDLDKLGLAKPVSTVSVWTEGVKEEKPEEKKDEKKDDKPADKKDEPKPKLVLDKDLLDKPAARLTYGAIEGEETVIKREANHKDWSESALVKAPKLLAEQAKAGPLTYYDKKLPQFNAFPDLPDKGVVKLELDHDGVHYAISRADTKPDTPWKFEEPKDWAGRKVDAFAVQNDLRALDDLRAASLVTEEPKEEDLDKTYGLKLPAVKAVVTKDDKTTYTYEFGKEAAGGGVYARQSQRPIVFVVEKKDVDALKGELRDRTIFAFDPAKVRNLKMSGWQKKTGGQVLTRDLERKADGTWTVKEPADLKMNFEKVTKFAEELSRLQAERFVSNEAAIKGEYAKEEKNAFTVEIKVEGVDAPNVLKVVDLTGDQMLPEADRQVYASTPQPAGELFQVPRTIFTAPAGKPMEIGPMDEAGYFSP
jgi:hypothetical protein